MSKQPVTREEALDYHQYPKAGKLAVTATTELSTQEDLSKAYTPGVAFPCLEIEETQKAHINILQKEILLQ